MMTRTILLACLLALPAAVHAQEKLDPGKILGQTPDSGSLPLSSKPSADARQDLGKTARTKEAGVVLVGNPKIGFGTAWVISMKHRLLVTNAHVADIRHEAKGNMIAVPSGTSQVYSVEKMWYHPGVRRLSKETAYLSVRSMDPNEGPIDPNSPDLAVLQLSSDGPDLTVEFPLATAEDLAILFAQPAAIMGFPGHDNKSMPHLGEKAAATFHEGVVSRITDFEKSASGPEAEKQFVQYTMATWPGFSGSPVFLPNGRVAAVHNSAEPATHKVGGVDHVVTIPHGIRADCVLEMFVFHGLDDKLPFKVDKTKVLVDRWTKPDAKSERSRANFAKAAALIEEASYQFFIKLNYEAGEKKCNEAIQLAPDFDKAYYARALGFINYRADFRDKLPEAAQVKIVKLAWEDAKKCNQLNPSDPLHVYLACGVKNALGDTTGNKEYYEESIAVLNDSLSSENLSTFVRMRMLSSRASAYGNYGDLDAALRDHNEAVRLGPDTAIIVENRGQFLRATGLGDSGEADYARAKMLRAKKIETGMKIQEVIDGGAAKKAGLHSGDIIVSVGETRVRSSEDLIAALAEVNGSIDILIINSETGKRETISVAPVAGKIGIKMVPADLK